MNYLQSPLIFEDYFELGKEEQASPFLYPKSRAWAANLTLKSSLFAAFLLALTFILSFYDSTYPLSRFLLIGVYFFAGIPSLIESVEDLLALEINIDILMTLAAFSSVLIGSGMEGGLLLVLFAVSGSIEDSVTLKAKGSIRSLHKLSPSTVRVVESNGTIIEKSVKDITLGTPILVRSGDVVPLDGIVIEGVSSVNLVHLTGENFPITKKKGNEVAAGGLNLEGALTLQVTHTSTDSTLARIIQLVSQAQEARPKLQRWFDQLSKGYAITIILLAAFFALSFPWFLSIPFLGHEGSIYRALAFLIAASPCALIIAIPIAYLSAVSVCAKQGILLKGGIALDALNACQIIAFDKTGTLTTGNLSCLGISSLHSAGIHNEKIALSVAYAMEQNAIHPIAQAITSFAQQENVLPMQLREFRAIPGFGLEAVVIISNQNMPVYIGHPEYILSKISPADRSILQAKAEEIENKGEIFTVLLLDKDIFIFEFADTLRSDIKKTINQLKAKRKWQLLMLTGDHEKSAKKIADELGIEEYKANLRPEDKLYIVSELSKDKGLAMIGDGVNDAPALARATVGIGMGKGGSTAAIDAAEIVFLHDNIEKLDWLLSKAIQTKNIVQQNLFIATSAILLASTPALMGIVPLWLAVILHEGGTLLVGLNALRLLKK